MSRDDIDLNVSTYRESDHIGTSTSDDEAPLREIGRLAFGIRYPRDVTPRTRLSAPRTGDAGGGRG